MTTGSLGSRREWVSQLVLSSPVQAPWVSRSISDPMKNDYWAGELSAEIHYHYLGRRASVPKYLMRT